MGILKQYDSMKLILMDINRVIFFLISIYRFNLPVFCFFHYPLWMKTQGVPKICGISLRLTWKGRFFFEKTLQVEAFSSFLGDTTLMQKPLWGATVVSPWLWKKLPAQEKTPTFFLVPTRITGDLIFSSSLLNIEHFERWQHHNFS